MINFDGSAANSGENGTNCSASFNLIEVDLHRGLVKIGCSEEKLEDKISLLNSQDVLTLAVVEATKAGMTNPMIKDRVIMYGDAETGKPSQKPPTFITKESQDDFTPFLVVTMHSSTVSDTTFQGDSL